MFPGRNKAKEGGRERWREGGTSNRLVLYAICSSSFFSPGFLRIELGRDDSTEDQLVQRKSLFSVLPLFLLLLPPACRPLRVWSTRRGPCHTQPLSHTYPGLHSSISSFFLIPSSIPFPSFIFQISACLVREEWTYHSQPSERKLLARTVEDTFHELTASCLSCAVFLKVRMRRPIRVQRQWVGFKSRNRK